MGFVALHCIDFLGHGLARAWLEGLAEMKVWDRLFGGEAGQVALCKDLLSFAWQIPALLG